MLSFAEEIYLLALDDVSGKVSSYSEELSMSYTLVSAILCELSFLNKIDIDMETDKLRLMDKKPTENKILDSILKILGESEKDMPVSYWLKVLLSNAGETEDLTLELLIEKGVLKKVDEKVFWVFHTRRYPMINDREIKDVEQRLREAILNDRILPTPKDSVLISLVSACDLFKVILSPKELKRCEKRIQYLSELDTVGKKVTDMVSKIRAFNPSMFCNAPI